MLIELSVDIMTLKYHSLVSIQLYLPFGKLSILFSTYRDKLCSISTAKALKTQSANNVIMT